VLSDRLRPTRRFPKRGTWELPAPATFVIDREGIIRWAFADWDYRKRADPDDVIKVVRSLGENE